MWVSFRSKGSITNNKNESIKDLLIKQIYSMVRWRESMEFMEQKGVNEFIEVGPGKVLTGLGKRMRRTGHLIIARKWPAPLIESGDPC